MNQIFNRRDQTPKRQELRREMPPAERRVWNHLCGVGAYVLDFYCPRLRLAIEIDGLSHDGAEAVAYDANRQREIEALGIQFLRFSNEQVYRQTREVIETIAEAVKLRERMLASGEK